MIELKFSKFSFYRSKSYLNRARGRSRDYTRESFLRNDLEQTGLPPPKLTWPSNIMIRMRLRPSEVHLVPERYYRACNTNTVTKRPFQNLGIKEEKKNLQPRFLPILVDIIVLKLWHIINRLPSISPIPLWHAVCHWETCSQLADAPHILVRSESHFNLEGNLFSLNL